MVHGFICLAFWYQKYKKYVVRCWASHNFTWSRYAGHVKDIFINGILSEDMSLYVHRPSVTDPTCA